MTTTERERHTSSIIDAMWEVVDQTPDHGEGSRCHLRTEFAWDVRDTYDRACQSDQSLYDDFEGNLGFEDIKDACLRDAARAVKRWLEEDQIDRVARSSACRIPVTLRGRGGWIMRGMTTGKMIRLISDDETATTLTARPEDVALVEAL